MLTVALQMLTRDRLKFASIVLGVTFAVFMIVEQASIFCGLMRRSGAVMLDVGGVDLWVFDARVKNVDDLRALKDTDLYRVRQVEGVEWTARFFKGQARARRRNGAFENVLVLGLDDATLVGAPKVVVPPASESDLLRRDAFLLDRAGAAKLGGVEAGEEMSFNDRRAVVAGFCEATRNFQSLPVVYTRYTQAIQWVPSERNTLSAVLARVKPGHDVAAVQRAIREQTGLEAKTPWEFRWMTIVYLLKYTGIAINIGTTVLLGFLVGAAVSGQQFYTFALDNLKQFGALKAMGASNLTLSGMIAAQAATTAAIGYGLGCGLAALVARSAGPNGQLPVYTVPEVLIMAGVAVLAISLLAGLVALNKVRRVEPAAVFR
ncbi:MAG TPA: ABC transporter permease [Planctomycetota bacterium]|nr:ABC transporter permease [Planctomycetota bacterium]